MLTIASCDILFIKVPSGNLHCGWNCDEEGKEESVNSDWSGCEEASKEILTVFKFLPPADPEAKETKVEGFHEKKREVSEWPRRRKRL